ncbi:MAG: tail fiber domain-containing protein [Peptostreptococcaceae bacterium]
MNNLNNNLMSMRSNSINLTLPSVDMVVKDKDNLRTGMVIFVIQTMATYKIMENLTRDIISDYAIKKSDGIGLKRIGEDRIRVTSNFDKEFIRIDNLKAIENLEISKITDITRDKMSIALYKDEAKDFYSFNPHAFNVKYEDEAKREVLSTKLITDEFETFEEYSDSLRYAYSGTNIRRGDILSFTLTGKSWLCDINGNPVSVVKENFISSRNTSGDIEPAFMMILNAGESYDIVIRENFGGTGNIDFGDGRIAIYTAPNLPFATKDQYGVIKVGHNISISEDGVASIPNATSYARGTVLVGDNIDVDIDGRISVKKGTKNDFGVVRLGETLALDSLGRTVVDVSKIATTVGLKEHSDKLTSKYDWGHVKVGENINVSDGVISIPQAARMTFGLVKVGSNIDYNDGVISLKYGSANDTGLVSAGSYLIASAFGRLSVDKEKLLQDAGVTAHLTTTATSNRLGHIKVGKNLSVTGDGTLSTHDPYNHPVSHPASIIIQDANNRFVTDVEKTRWNGKFDSAGGQITGNIIITTDSMITFSRNTDMFNIGFKNDSDTDQDSYAYFETGDNGNEYFKWRHRLPSGALEDWMTLKPDALRYRGHVVYHTGNFNADGIVRDGGGYGTITLSNWIRTSGNSGLHMPSWGGSIWMQDWDYIRFNKNIYSDGFINVSDAYIRSDIKSKKNISRITECLDKVGKLNGYTYTYRFDDRDSAGLIAQEVEKILPMLVRKSPDGYKNLQYNGIIGLLVGAINELHELIKTGGEK